MLPAFFIALVRSKTPYHRSFARHASDTWRKHATRAARSPHVTSCLPDAHLHIGCVSAWIRAQYALDLRWFGW